VPSMPVVPVPMVYSLPTVTGPTSLLLRSSLRRIKRLLSSFASRPSPEAAEVLIPLVMYTALQLVSIPTKETLVCIFFPETPTGHTSDRI
jgi:hypothetical protein